MAKKSQAQQNLEAKEAAQEALKLVEQEARLRERMNSGYDEYIKAVREAHALQETLNKNKKIEEEVDKRIKLVQANKLKMSKEELAAEVEKLKILQKQNGLIEKQVVLYKTAAKEVNVGAMALGKSLKGLKDVAMKLPGLVKNVGSEIKGLGIFEMDKAMKQTALSMGVLTKESVGMRNTITNVAKQTTMIGVGLAKVAKLQEDYSVNLGRNVLLNEKGLNAMAQMSIVTGLGAEGTAQMAADMDLVGLSAERTGDFVNKTLKSSNKMGLNASKVMKNIAGNMKILNKYHFKEGVKGLSKMAELVTKLGVDMEAASGMADKLWDIEGAVEMSAQLNVMGGAWAKMADPFHLMYMARNDMKGLTEEIANAAKETVSFNNETGEFDMTAEGMHRLKIIAEQTGMAYEDLVTMGKNASKFEKIESQIGFRFGSSKEDEQMKEYLTSKSFLDKKGDATIMINGSPKLVKSLTEGDKNLIKAQIVQQEDMQKRAEEARTFDEQLGYFIDQLKVYLLPMLTGINKMMPKLDGLVDKFNAKGGWGEKIEIFAKTIGELVGSMGSFLIENPKLVASILGFTKAMPLVIGGLKLLGGVWDAAKWFANGVSLAKGFNTVASAGGSGDSSITDMLGDSTGKGFSFGRTTKAIKGGFKGGGIKGALKGGGKSLLRQGKGVTQMAGSALKGGIKGLGKGLVGKIPLIGALASMGIDVAENGLSMETLGRGALSGIGGAIGGGLGAIGGLGAASVPLGIAGGVGGSMFGDWVGDKIYGERQEVQDGIAEPGRGPFTITDKFGKMAKTHAKDGLEVGPHVGSKSGGGIIKHEFGTLNISGTITLNTPGGSETFEMVNNQKTRRKITRMVQEETIKQFNLGKPKG